jgi:hypothetical protein
MILYTFRRDCMLSDFYIAFDSAYDQHSAKLAMRDLFEHFENVKDSTKPPEGKLLLGLVVRTPDGPRLRRESDLPPPNPSGQDHSQKSDK